MSKKIKQKAENTRAVDTRHPEYNRNKPLWIRIRDCMAGEDVIKSKKEVYLPRPKGMDGEYKDAYNAYIERAHFPLIVSYALQGALGVILNKLPDFHVPSELEYILKKATKDGKSIKQLFLDIIIDIFQTGRVPLLVDVLKTNEFRFVQYNAESFINWKTSSNEEDRDTLILGVFEEFIPASDDIFSHDVDEVYRVLMLNEEGLFETALYGADYTLKSTRIVPKYMGTPLREIPLYMSGSLHNGFQCQPIPLISVANCSIQIYRKEADLANSEFLSCNPTLVIVGANNDDDLPNVVGSSVMIVIPNEQARVFYTTTDTAALTHVKSHIDDLYDEAIRHGVAILDARKGVEAAEALRIRQATQSASIYSIYLSAMTAIEEGLKMMCRWAGYDEDKVKVDAPNSLTYGVPDSGLIKEIIEGLGKGAIPLPVIHRYLISSGLIDPAVNYEEYVKMLAEQKKLTENNTDTNNEDNNNNGEDDSTDN